MMYSGVIENGKITISFNGISGKCDGGRSLEFDKTHTLHNKIARNDRAQFPASRQFQRAIPNESG